MKTTTEGLVMDKIIILDATPMMADVISGAVPRPEPFQPSPDGTPWQETRSWWHYAVKTPAGHRALELIGCTVVVETPWKGTPDGWRVQPWEDPGLELREISDQFGHIVSRLKEAIGDTNAGTFFAEVCILDFKTCEYVRSHQTMIALNIDGTRAAIAQ